MKTRARTISIRDLPSSFEGLCRFFPPRPIHDKVDWQNATELIDAMAGHSLNQDQEDYLEVLSDLVGVYEDRHHSKILSHISPLEALRELVERNGLSASSLGELLGNRSIGSKILRGERELSKSHIRILARHFSVDPALFLGR